MRSGHDRPESAVTLAGIRNKTLIVTGERRIVKRLLPTRMCVAALRFVTLGLVQVPPWRVTSPTVFNSLPLRYESAYGGENLIEARGEDRDGQVRQIGKQYCLTPEQAAQHPTCGSGKGAPLAHVAHEENPVGSGFALPWYLKSSRITHLPAPRVEYPDSPFSAEAFWRAVCGRGTFRVAGMAAIGRTWLPRRELIGTISASTVWYEEELPSLPPEFDHGYWNCAPADQQCAYLQGDEFITLVNLAAEGSAGSTTNESGENVLRFQLPGMRPFLAVGDHDQRIGVKPCVLDTVYIDPEAGTVQLVWRAVVSTDAGLGAIQLRVADSEAVRTQLERFLRVSTMGDAVDVDNTVRGDHGR
jgi:hypothetical protein